MGLISDIIKIARGSASSAAPETVESIEAALAKIAAERADAKLQLQGGHDKRKAMLRADASDAEVAAFDAELDGQRLKLERLEIVEDDLLGRLEAARSDRRRALWKASFQQFEVAFPQYIGDLRKALESFQAVIAIREEARQLGFEHEVIAQMPLDPPLFVDAAAIATAESQFERIREAAAGRPKDEPRRLATPGTADLPQRQPVRRNDPKTPKQSAPRPRRAPIREIAKDGERLVSVVRPGYEAPSGLQCIVGDVIALPAADANTAASQGAVDLLMPPTGDANANA